MQEPRFEFGENWTRFLADVDESRIVRAEESLRGMLAVDDLGGLTFLDVGSGSGLFSLAARRLGAQVHSFDYDRNAVACTAELKHRYAPDDEGWQIQHGSILDHTYLDQLGRFDVVYAWGVLHHTGQLWKAIGNAVSRVRPGGLLYLAIYNDQGLRSTLWRVIKRTYNILPPPTRFLLIWPAVLATLLRTGLRDLKQRRRPFHTWQTYHYKRGMSPFRDIVDWIGGYPFEVARPHDVIRYCGERGFRLQRSRLAAGHGNNEYLFRFQPV